MKYVGSKRRIAKYIVPIIESYREGRDFYDIFCGGGNLVQHISGTRYASDVCPYLIGLLNAVKNGWIPPTQVSEQQYQTVRFNSGYSLELTGFIGYCCSFGGKWFGGYARGKNKGEPRNYANEASRHLVKQAPLLKDITFYVADYKTLSFYDKLIYCDPPYANTTKYKDKFDHDYFWDWAYDMSRKNTVIVSEYHAPQGWECIWSKEVNSSLDLDTGSKKNIERLYVRSH